MLVVQPAGGLQAANAPPRLVLKTSPLLDTSTTPPTLSGEAPFTVQLNLCNSDDPDAGDSINWQFHFGDTGRPAFNPDGTFNPDFDHFCRVDHEYREGTRTATVSVTDKHLEDQSRRAGEVTAMARTSQQIRIADQRDDLLDQQHPERDPRFARARGATRMELSLDPATAVKYGLFVQAAYEMYDLNPDKLSPPPGPCFPSDYKLYLTIQMKEYFLDWSRSTRISTCWTAWIPTTSTM